ncbi:MULTISPECIES: RNA ligase family protein [unclassified Mesorhizobium]|uniref:ATP-dependent DNA ligase n=1 Tax=unclassified Mesorhizobium TaxID=325217 RepID=UPI002415A45A|nr:MULTISPECIES: RNA ligase family protein [unclassified Mesorhizobium]MDG4904560.1 RNA ligase family protein [Mesorhizobium sp. WSM4962]MDG4920298.1 RNA ligase family protein [Mesorhizobium sp. WSM4989]
MRKPAGEARLYFIRPLEPIQVETPPVSDDWLHEIKYDGYRIQVILDGAGARAFSRHGHDWSQRYWPIVAAAEKLPAKAFILDGEMIAPEPDGRPNFHRMHSRMVWNAEQLAFVAFDILHLDGQDLRSLPLMERKAKLWNLIKPAKGIIQYGDHVEGNGAAFFEAVEQMALEGMVSKRRERPYRSGKCRRLQASGHRTRAWEACCGDHGARWPICRHRVHNAAQRPQGTALEACPGGQRAKARAAGAERLCRCCRVG